MIYSKEIIVLGRAGWGGEALPYKRLIGMCRWMGSHFHDWTDYNGVAFSKELSPRVTNMGSTIGQRIDYNGVGALRGQRHIPSKN